MRYKKTLIFSFLIFTLILGLFNVRPVKSALADITYNLNNNVLYNSNGFNYDYSFNLDDNITSYSENYNASYSFENDTLESYPDYFIVDVGIGCQIGVIANLDGHNKIVRMNTTTTGVGHGSYIRNSFTSQSYGTIEFWFQSNNVDASHVNYIRLRNVNTITINLFAQSDKWQYNDGASKDVPNVPIPLDNIWQHIKIDFELTAGSYLGMAQYQSIFTINGISSGVVNIQSNQASVDNFRIANSAFHANYEQRFDAIGYSWLSNYTIGNNLIPITEIDFTLKQISGYEFAFLAIDSLVSLGAISHLSTIESWVITGTIASIINDDKDDALFTGSGWYRDRKIQINAVGVASSYISKDNLGLINNFINITSIINISAYANNGGYIANEFYSSVKQLLDLRIYKSGGLLIYAYFDGGYTSLYSGMNLNDIYETNVFINLEIDRAFILLYENGIIIGYYNIPLMNSNEVNVDEVIWGTDGIGGNTITFNIDNIGVYENGLSKVDNEASFGYLDIAISTTEKWDNTHQNLLTITAIGNINLFKFSVIPIIPYIPSLTAQTILVNGANFTTHNNLSIFLNMYNTEQFNPQINNRFVIYVKQNVSLSYLNIKGVSLNEGSNKYWLKYTHSGIDTNESYFYVDSSNRLQFNLITNDTDLEYIQAEFNILDVSSSDRAIKFKSNIDNNAFGYFRVNFTDISNFIPIPIFDKTTRVFISQNKTISSFIILITDENDDTISDLTEGYVSDIELLFVVGIGISITVSNLLTVIIPLIIIFIPTFLLSSRVGKNMIVPLMMLMSLICVATEIIPLWLFFVIIFPSSLFLFLKRKELI